MTHVYPYFDDKLEDGFPSVDGFASAPGTLGDWMEKAHARARGRCTRAGTVGLAPRAWHTLETMPPHRPARGLRCPYGRRRAGPHLDLAGRPLAPCVHLCRGSPWHRQRPLHMYHGECPALGAKGSLWGSAMKSVELDHVFICTAAGAPEADLLSDLGLTEGPPNVHPGQGTVNRRFCFQNALLELLWVHDPEQAQNAYRRPTHLWERLSTSGVTWRPWTDGAIQWRLDGDSAIRGQTLQDLVGWHQTGRADRPPCLRPTLACKP